MTCDDCCNSSDGICEAHWPEWSNRLALEAGIPLSVIEGKTRLRDHFSQEYIDAQCGRNKPTE